MSGTLSSDGGGARPFTGLAASLPPDLIRLMLERIPLAVVRLNGQGCTDYLNPVAQRLLGGSAGDPLTQLFADPSSAERLLASAGPEPSAWQDMAMRSGSDGQRVFAWSFVRLDDASLLAFCLDVQPSREMERRLRESEADFRSVYESNVVPFFFWRNDGCVTGANDAFLALTGHTRDDLAACRIDWVSLASVDHRERRSMGRVLLGGRAVAEPFEEELVRKDGARVPVLAGGATFPDLHGGVGFAIDLSERRAAEQELRRLNAELNDAMAELKTSQRREIQVEKLTALGTLAAGIAHEINNPMMAVMNYLDYVGRAPLGAEAAAALDKALDELGRMRDLLQNMLAFAGPASGGIEAVDAAQLVESAIDLMRPELAEQGIRVSVDLAPGLPPLRAREKALQRALVTLLMNARDAVERAAEKHIRVSAHRRSGFVAIQVEDSGPGVPAEIRDRIFDPFFTTKPPGRGTGLGLSIARSIMLELGGDLYFQEPATRGALFTLLVPGISAADQRAHDET